jgi:carbamoyltransferase
MARLPLVLGINSAYHESAAALARGGELIFAVEEERYTRVKRAKPARIDNPDQLPWNAIQACLDAGGVDYTAIDRIAYSFLPGLRQQTIAADPIAAHSPRAFGHAEGEAEFDRRVRAVPQRLAERTGLPQLAERFCFLPHHLCHAASAFFASPFSKAAILVVDGIGENATAWLGYGDGERIERLEEVPYPHSIGLLWERAAVYAGFSEYDASKLMGLAAYGDKNRYRAQIDRLFPLRDALGANGALSFAIDPALARFRADDVQGFVSLFGPRYDGERREGSRFADLAAGLQARTDQALLALARRLQRITGERCLAYAGGVALNCVSNVALEREGPFDEIYITGAAHDAGTALGAALLGAIDLTADSERPTPNTREIHWPSLTPFTGPSFTNDDYRAALEAETLRAEFVDDQPLFERVASMIARGKIVAFFDGPLEFGPRALGHRSLLADPRDRETRERLNRNVKHREPFRPFAASILAEEAKTYFEMPVDRPGARCSRELMLLAYAVRPQCATRIPAVVHADGTCRIQTVEAPRNPRYHGLIEAFFRQTGVPLLLNTSFNDQEPIVCSPQQAIATFRKTNIDALVLGNYLLPEPVGL